MASGDVDQLSSYDFSFPTTNPDFKVTAVSFSNLGGSGQFNATTGLGTYSASSAFASNNNSSILLGTVTFQISGLGNPGTLQTLGTKTPTGLDVLDAYNLLTPLPYTTVDAFQMTSYLGDVASSYGAYNGADATAIQLEIVHSVNAYAEYGNVDPNLISDTTKDGLVNGADVTNLQLAIVGSSSSTLPALPANSGTTGTGLNTVGPDPYVFINTSALGTVAPGQQNVEVPIEITNTSSAPITLSSADFAVQFDPSVLTFNTEGVTAVLLQVAGPFSPTWSTATRC